MILWSYFFKLYNKTCIEIKYFTNIRIKSQLTFTTNIKNAFKKNYIFNSLMTKVLKILFDTKILK